MTRRLVGMPAGLPFCQKYFWALSGPYFSPDALFHGESLSNQGQI
jgi:hypothetical protein